MVEDSAVAAFFTFFLIADIPIVLAMQILKSKAWSTTKSLGYR
jgi:hypothetical protein